MPQVFHPVMNTISRVSIFGAVFFIVAIVLLLMVYVRSPYYTGAQVVIEQPVPFSHQHHVADCGIDCRYCHTSVEKSAFAGIPPTETCMNCHSQIWSDAPILEPIRASLRDNVNLTWTRVHDLPDFVYFSHQIHVKQGVGCETCHGAVDQMPLVSQEASLLMEWCLDCHRAPEKYLRPREEVFNMQYEPPADQIALGLKLKAEYNIAGAEHMTSCSVCHR